MKYAHLADLHLGSWRDQKMRDLSTKAFLKAMNQCIEKRVDFILFSGDLFNTSLPSLDTLKIVTEKLKELQDLKIPLYVIAGSHDFSPSGKTMIEVLEKAGLLKNVCKGKINEKKELQLEFTEDQSGIKITGVIGRRGLLDKTYYENLDRLPLEQEPGYKIFMFHTTVAELVPEHLNMIESQPASLFPKGFNYYAGGHIHHPTKVDVPGIGLMTYPGALFPNNFAEVEKYSHGGYYLIEDNKIEWLPVLVIKHLAFSLNCNNKTPEKISQAIIEYFLDKNVKDTIITIRLKGQLISGSISEINFKEILQKLYDQGAYFVMKNTTKLQSEEFEEIKIAQSTPEIIEDQIIKEHLQQIKVFDQDKEFQLTKYLLAALNTSKLEGETVTDFNRRILKEIENIIK